MKQQICERNMDSETFHIVKNVLFIPKTGKTHNGDAADLEIYKTIVAHTHLYL